LSPICCPKDTQQQSEHSYWSGDTYSPLVFVSFFLGGGIITMVLWSCLNSLSVVELESGAYDQIDGCNITGLNYTDDNYPGVCSFSLTVEEDMYAPIYFSYRMNNFWQNHREYRQAYSTQQLIGESADTTTNCLDIKTYNGENIYPCGNIAYSFFCRQICA